MKKRTLIFTALLLVLVLAASIGTTLSYFTTYVTAEGGYRIGQGGRTRLREEVKGYEKSVQVDNPIGHEPVWVRVKAFYGGDLTVTYVPSGAWAASPDIQGFYVYGQVLGPGESTASDLKIQINNVPVNAHEGDTFNVIVIYEATPALYDESGNPLPPNWDLKPQEGGQG